MLHISRQLQDKHPRRNKLTNCTHASPASDGFCQGICRVYTCAVHITASLHGNSHLAVPGDTVWVYVHRILNQCPWIRRMVWHQQHVAHLWKCEVMLHTHIHSKTPGHWSFTLIFPCDQQWKQKHCQTKPMIVMQKRHVLTAVQELFRCGMRSDQADKTCADRPQLWLCDSSNSFTNLTLIHWNKIIIMKQFLFLTMMLLFCLFMINPAHTQLNSI